MKLSRCLKALALTLICSPLASAQANKTLAAQPPMGWNSWDAYGLTITESQFRDNVDVLAKTLKPFGWNYAVIDEGWFLKNPLDRGTPDKLAYQIDANGRYIPVPARFPSALINNQNTGFEALGTYVHSQGLKFGIHIVRGIPRQSVADSLPIANSKFHAQDAADTTDPCPWDPTNWGVRDTPAGQAWYDSLLAQYAAWGVDYLKVDCISDHPYKPTEIRMLHRAILKTGRPIILSLSPGPTSPGIATELIPYAQMWRISDDIWDYWTNTRHFPRSLHDQFELAAAWAPYARPGTWPDADMLPLGFLGPIPGDGEARQSRLTHDEQQTMLTLWSMARSPLILGANLTKLDDWTTKLITNPDVLAVDQFGHDQRQVAREGNAVAWTSAGKGDIRYLALFNLNDKDKTIDRTYAFYNLPAGSYRARELWSHTDRGVSTAIHVTLPPHACILLELQPN
ncbi:glycoside hydrolase family 27 protein [Granulicella tundricola]|uniref:Alpha-galactosidase n=1 Tax=Granulicella tundricola (strain ATCC BAA-1859 / DSM 23138 / MP5ACTX9) TaxID=1198114 RepID=E8WYV3_GRATM|nr:glycoside hydrolase family 27 protein [Granulicella tundricola]ADW68789.1 glycoside hydrolase, clan GH-D [Granulicella tundricola MP5ACTX9]